MPNHSMLTIIYEQSGDSHDTVCLITDLYLFQQLVWEGLPLNVKELVISGLLPFITELRKHTLSPGTNLDLPT